MPPKTPTADDRNIVPRHLKEQGEALATRMLGSSSSAQDVVQDSLASVWLTRHRLDASKPVGPYLTTIVLNRCRDRLRRRKVVGFFGFPSSDEVQAVADDTPDPENLAASREQLRLVEAEIGRPGREVGFGYRLEMGPGEVLVVWTAPPDRT